MKNKKNRWKCSKVITGAVVFLLLLCVIPTAFVQAASATILLDTEQEEIRVGDIVEVQLVISANTTIGDFEAFLKYNDMVLEFYSAASCITGGGGMLKIADIGASPSSQDRTYRIYFQALKQGECEVALYERPVVYSYLDGIELSVTGFSKTFTVLSAEDASSDSSLSALYLVDNASQPVVLTPMFSSDVTTYHAIVNNSSETLIMSAITTDTKASVIVLGGEELVVGLNEISVIVTAEDGLETVYTIFVHRLEETKSTEEIEVSVLDVKFGITAKVIEETTELTQYQTYRVCEKPEDFVIPDGYVETILIVDGVQITAYVKKEATKEEFLLLTLKNEAGEVNWYRYDRIEQTIQRVCEEEYIITQTIQQNDELLQEAVLQYELQQKILIITIAVLFGIVLVLLMVVLWLCIRRKNRG